MNEKIKSIINDLKKELMDLSEFIYHNPELGFEEYKSSQAHIDLLKKHNFEVEEYYIGIETAFRAEFKSGKGGPNIAYLAEYDALPEMGHGCGHNILGTTSTGAGIALSKVIEEVGGNVIVLGTPAEETSGAKIDMVEKGVFDDIDVVMICHPSAKHVRSGGSIALHPLELTFKGRASHAAAFPENGINALDAAILTFNAINALREHVRPDTRIHGIIKNGGEAANIVPDLSVVQLYVRSPYKDYLEEVVEKVKNCARGASIATGTKLDMTVFEKPYDNMITNETLSNVYEKHLIESGVKEIIETNIFPGSLDTGNVSHVCPAIHPFFGICEDGINLDTHTREFAEATLTETAYNNMVKTIYALVLTGIDVIQDEKLLSEIKDEFKQGN